MPEIFRTRKRRHPTASPAVPEKIRTAAENTIGWRLGGSGQRCVGRSLRSRRRVGCGPLATLPAPGGMRPARYAPGAGWDAARSLRSRRRVGELGRVDAEPGVAQAVDEGVAHRHGRRQDPGALG
ncbi:Uncharacterised protein [Clostridioides difficile]|nr:Uncharacterised protein [Clostridioides difficile]